MRRKLMASGGKLVCKDGALCTIAEPYAVHEPVEVFGDGLRQFGLDAPSPPLRGKVSRIVEVKNEPDPKHPGRARSVAMYEVAAISGSVAPVHSDWVRAI